MTKERLIQLRFNCSMIQPNMVEIRELYEYILGEKILTTSDPWLATQLVVLKYVDELIERG